jgi:hypothetical protein
MCEIGFRLYADVHGLPHMPVGVAIPNEVVNAARAWVRRNLRDAASKQAVPEMRDRSLVEPTLSR